jgi:hypothetical protein
MTAPNVIELPLRPAAEPAAPPREGDTAQARAPVREARPSRLPSGTAVTAVLSGASLIHSPPPALMAVWAQHCAAARYYHTPVLRWFRYAYGAWHTWVEVPLWYFLAWSGDSPPKRAMSVAVVVATLWLLKVI